MALRFVQSKDEQVKILQACHVDTTAGHMGKTRTIFRIKERFTWHGMVKDVKDLVRLVVCVRVCVVQLLVITKYKECGHSVCSS